MAYSIMLDAGHGGAKDPGAVYEGRREKDDNLKLVLAIGEILSDRGLDVEYTRTTDVYETPYEKAVKANNAGVDLFISIHRNSFPVDNEVEGVESLVYDLSGLKYEMAQNINEQLEGVGFVNLGVKARPNLVVLKRTKMPAVLVEVGFINSDTDNQLFDDNFQDIAQAIADNPKLLILDEPTSGVDPASVIHLQNLFEKLNQGGTTIFMASHNLDEINRLCSHIAILNRGVFQVSGGIEDVINEHTKKIIVKIQCHRPDDFNISSLIDRYSLLEATDLYLVFEVKAQSDIPHLINALVSYGVSIFSVALQKTTLEDIFLS